MGLTAGTPMREIAVDTVFIGSCTNGRIEDLRAAAGVIEGRKVADGVRMLVVPGSMQVRAQAEAEGLDKIFTAAGAEWRCGGLLDVPGHEPGQARAAASAPRPRRNRNFEGRQGKGGRTHLVSPAGRRRHGRHRPPDRPRRPVRRARTIMEPFVTHTGRALPLRRTNVDTDQIIPAVYLKRVTRTGSTTGCSPPGARTRRSC